MAIKCLEPPAFENAAGYIKCETNSVNINDRPMFFPSLVKLGPRTPAEPSGERARPQNWTAKMC